MFEGFPSNDLQRQSWQTLAIWTRWTLQTLCFYVKASNVGLPKRPMAGTRHSQPNLIIRPGIRCKGKAAQDLPLWYTALSLTSCTMALSYTVFDCSDLPRHTLWSLLDCLDIPCIYIYIYVCAYIYMYINMYVCTVYFYICIYIYI